MPDGSDYVLHLHTKYGQFIYQLINKSNLPEACGCAISKDRLPEGTLKAKESEANAKLSGELTPQHVLIPCCSEQADGFQRNSTIFSCSRGLKMTGSQPLLI